MQNWILDRSQISDPILQMGWSGLALLLTHGEASDRYPEVKQTDRLRWSLTETTITIEFEEPSDLHLLLNCQLGDFRDGVGIVPGYEVNPNRPGFYVTARAHGGICGGMFASKKGARRSWSLGEKDKRKAHEAVHGPVLDKVDNLLAPWATEKDPARLVMTVTPHRRAASEDGLAFDLTPKGAFSKATRFGNVVHPGLAQWNFNTVQGPPQDYFLASFSCLSYFWTHSSQVGVIGLGNIAPTLSEVLRLTTRWTIRGESLYSVAGDAYAAAWAIAAALRLPPGSYPLVYALGKTTIVGSFQAHSMGGYALDSIYKMLDSLSENLSPEGSALVLRRMASIPVRVFKDKTVTVLDIIFRNLQSGRHWCVGLGDGVTTDRNHYTNSKKPLVGFLPKERALLALIADHLGDTMERQIANRMSYLHWAVTQTFKPVYGQRAYEKARDFCVATHLNRVNTYGGLLKAINEIRQKAGMSPAGQFTAEEFDWLLAQAKRDLLAVKHLLILACGGVDFRTPEEKAEAARKKAAKAAKTAASQTPDTDDTDEPTAADYNQFD